MSSGAAGQRGSGAAGQRGNGWRLRPERARRGIGPPKAAPRTRHLVIPRTRSGRAHAIDIAARHGVACGDTRMQSSPDVAQRRIAEQRLQPRGAPRAGFSPSISRTKSTVRQARRPAHEAAHQVGLTRLKSLLGTVSPAATPGRNHPGRRAATYCRAAASAAWDAPGDTGARGTPLRCVVGSGLATSTRE